MRRTTRVVTKASGQKRPIWTSVSTSGQNLSELWSSPLSDCNCKCGPRLLGGGGGLTPLVPGGAIYCAQRVNHSPHTRQRCITEYGSVCGNPQNLGVKVAPGRARTGPATSSPAPKTHPTITPYSRATLASSTKLSQQTFYYSFSTKYDRPVAVTIDFQAELGMCK